MSAVRAMRERVAFRNNEEVEAWIRFAAGAATGLVGDSEDVAGDAKEAADMADALLLQFRKRCEK